MSTPLLETKLFIPPVRPDLVSRPRLIERLNEGLHMGRKLTLISAPAGFGKTTLLSEWAAECGQPVAWLSLYEGDNDPTCFWTYVIAALQTIPALREAGVGEAVLAALQSSQPLPTESVLTALINEIAASPNRFILILDDYHLITAQPIHDALSFLLDHLPHPLRGMHLAVATRADPSLPTARLRGRGQLTELRFTDLRFTSEEATEFLNQAVHLDLSTEDVVALASRTEGWIAGLLMAAAAMRGRTDVTRFIQAFTGSDRYILDYLIEEVFNRQTELVQTFLLHTSILERLTGPLCDAVVGKIEDWGSEIGAPTQYRVQSRTILEYLESSNLLIVPLDNERQWYRYHRLFADLLRSRLQREHGSLVPTLHRRASAWYEQNGLMAPAIEHALSAEDFERAASLIERVAEKTLMRSEVATFLRWVERLPDERVRVRPSLCAFHAWALLLSGCSLDIVESRLQDADSSGNADKTAPLRALIAVYQGQMSLAEELSRLALERLSEDDLFLRSVAAWVLGLSQLADGDLAVGSQVLGEVIKVSQQVGNVMITVTAISHLAKLKLRQGRLHEAKATYERALGLATDSQDRPLPIAGEALMGLGNLFREWNQLEMATRYLEEGIELTKRWGEALAMEGYIGLARVRQAQGDADGARDAIQRAQQLAITTDATELDDLVVALEQARLWVAQGNIEAALRWVEAQGVQDDTTPFAGFISSRLRKYEHLVLVRVLIKQGRPGEALPLLDPLLTRMVQQGRIDLLIETQILKALAFQAQGDGDQALSVLEQALTNAEPGGFVRIFVDEGEPMAQMLYVAAARGIAPQYAGRLLAAFPTAEATPQRERPAEMVEPLSERELEVLQLIGEGFSNREIAQELTLSVNTVKVHTSNIYGKLGVNSRTQAVARARALGILPSS
jgi:LuxR family maltose regulon positive regulatory protein